MCTVLTEILTLVSERIKLLLVINKLRLGNQSVLCEGHGSDYTLATRHILFPPHFQAIFDDIWTVRLRHCHAFSFHMRVTNFAVDIIPGRKRGVSQLPQSPEPWLHTYRNSNLQSHHLGLVEAPNRQ